MSGLIHHLSISQSHVFLLNSRLGLFTAASHRWVGAPSPEVTGQFCLVPWPRITRAPQDSLLDHLCRFAVRAFIAWSLAGFLGSMVTCTIGAPEGLPYCRGSAGPADLPTGPIPTPFNPGFRHGAAVSLLRRRIAAMKGTGMLTSCPSASPFGLALGPD